MRLLSLAMLILLAACAPAPQPPPTEVVTSTSLPTARPTLTLTAEPPNAAALVAELQGAIARADAPAIVAMLDQTYRFGYALYIEGGQSVSTDEFYADLAARLPSAPSCLGYLEDEYSVQVWFEGWSPAWEMHELCYSGCQPLDETWYSTTAGFLFNDEDGRWVLKALFLNEPASYYYREFSLAACN